MNPITYRLKLLDLKNWYEGWANRLAEQATLDSQSNFEFRLALAKLAAVEHNLRRIDRGEFERCEACGILMTEERLDVLLDSDNHWCTRCAGAHGAPARQWEPARPNAHLHRSAPASAILAAA